MRPVRQYTLPRAADADGIAASQTPSGAGDLTLDGALVSAGVAYIRQTGTDSGGRPYGRHGQYVTITSAGNDSGRTFTVYGTDADGAVRTESITGENAGTATGTVYWAEVTQIAVDAATAGAVTAGIAVTGAFGIVPLDHYIGDGVALSVQISGTMTYTVEDTQDDINAQTWRDGWQWRPETGNWLNHDDSNLVAATADAKGNYQFVPIATRCKWSAWTSDEIEFQVTSARFW